jgi:hypothetical protein
MKSTIKLDGMAALVIQPDGSSVALTITVGAIPVQKKLLDLGALGALLAALEGAGAEAQAYKDALERAATYRAKYEAKAEPITCSADARQ